MQTNESQKNQLKTVEDKINHLDAKERACQSEKLDIIVEKTKVESSFDTCKNERNNLINYSNQATLKGTECYAQLDMLVNNVREVSYQIARNPDACQAKTKEGELVIAEHLESIQSQKGVNPIDKLQLTLQNADYPQITAAPETNKKGLFSRNKDKER